MQFTPVVDDTSRGYRFAGDAVIEGLLRGVVRVPWQMASPPGFDATGTRSTALAPLRFFGDVRVRRRAA